MRSLERQGQEEDLRLVEKAMEYHGYTPEA